MSAIIAKGLEGIVANTTNLSDVLGNEGILIYAGYNINEIAGKATFEEVTYLLWHGELPNKKQLDVLTDKLRAARELPAQVVDFLKTAPKDAPPMDVIRTAVSMLGLYDETIKDESPAANYQRAVDITAKIGVIAAYFHRARKGLDLPPVRADLGEAAHFLYLITGTEPTEQAARTLDVAYVLHADHGMNASTFAARDRKDRSEEISRQAERVVNRGGVEIDIRVEPLALLHDLRNVLAHADPFRLAELVAECHRHRAEVRRAGIEGFVNAVPDTHDFFLLGELVFNPGVHIFLIADLLEHVDHALIRAAVERAFESSNRGGDR